MRRARSATLLTGLVLLAHHSHAQVDDTQPAAEGEQPAVDRPESSRRVVRHFDFEEISNPYDVPRYWRRAPDPPTDSLAIPRFPAWNLAALDFNVSHQGVGSVCLPTRGGSTRLRLDPGVIPVFPDGDYVVSAVVRFDRLRHAEAAIAVRLLDTAAKPIEGSEALSDRLRPPIALDDGQMGPAWRPVSVAVRGRWPDAAFMQIDLLLLQPDPPEPGRHDLAGAIWFDDLTVTQVPQIRLSTDAPSNIAVGGVPPRVTLTVRDLSGEPLSSTLVVQDAAGRVIDQHVIAITPGRASHQWQPRLPGFGWYRASLELASSAGVIGTVATDFLWLADSPTRAPPQSRRRAGTDHRRLSLLLSRLPDGDAATIAAGVSRMGGGSVTLPAWTRTLRAENVGARALELAAALAPLATLGVETGLSLAELPNELVDATGQAPADAGSLLASDPQASDTFLFPFLNRLSQRVDRWAIGPRLSTVPMTWRDAGDLAAASDAIGRLLPGATIERISPVELLPAPASSSPGSLRGQLVVVPHSTPPDAMSDLAAAWLEAGAAAGLNAVTLVMEPGPGDTYGRDAAARNLARQVIELWRAMPASDDGSSTRLATSLLDPWRWERGAPMPTVSLAVWANLIDRLVDRRIVGSFPIADGVRCYILAPVAGAPRERGGAIVAWNAGADPDAAALVTYLGDGPVECIDLFGNRSPVHLTEDPAPGNSLAPRGRHAVAIPADPVFIEGVDLGVLQFQASFQIQPAVVSVEDRRHDLELILHNPWPTRLDGQLAILEPGGLSDPSAPRDPTWDINPRSLPFSIAPGGTARLPVHLALSSITEIGPVTFVVDVDLASAAHYGTLRLRAPLEVRMGDIHLEVFTRSAPGGDAADLVVEVQVSNNGQTARTLEITCRAPGLPRGKTSISALAPGATAVRRFSYPGAAGTLRGEVVAVTLADVETGARVSRSATVD